METDRLQIRTACLCAGAVIALEAGARLGIGGKGVHPMAVLGGVRLLQAGLVFTIVFLTQGCLAPIGLSGRGLIPGIQRGLIWSAGFGLLVLAAGMLIWAIGVDPLSLIDVSIPKDPTDRLFFFMAGGLIAPVTEEIFFRGVLYGFFRRWGLWAAVLFSTLAFVLAHPLLPGVPIPQIIGGLLFALAYEVEKDLIIPITLHVSGNMAIFGLSLIA